MDHRHWHWNDRVHQYQPAILKAGCARPTRPFRAEEGPVTAKVLGLQSRKFASRLKQAPVRGPTAARCKAWRETGRRCLSKTAVEKHVKVRERE